MDRFFFPDKFLAMSLDQTTEITLPLNTSSYSTSPVTIIGNKLLLLSTSQPSTVVVGKQHKNNRDYLKTDAPMLNYIFDSHSSKGKHHHHDTYKWGPHFEPSEIHLNGTTVTVQVGDTALLNCKVNFLQDKTVCNNLNIKFDLIWKRKINTIFFVNRYLGWEEKKITNCNC